MAQMGFFDLSDRYASLDAKKDPLVEINAVVPWEEFRPLLEQVWRKPESERKSNAGRKPLDAVLMFRTLVLSALYNLSDDQVEYQIRDRLSFMRFLGLGLGDRVPDAKTVWLYREALAQAGKMDEVFKLFDGQGPRPLRRSLHPCHPQLPNPPGSNPAQPGQPQALQAPVPTAPLPGRVLRSNVPRGISRSTFSELAPNFCFFSRAIWMRRDWIKTSCTRKLACMDSTIAFSSAISSGRIEAASVMQGDYHVPLGSTIKTSKNSRINLHARGCRGPSWPPPINPFPEHRKLRRR